MIAATKLLTVVQKGRGKPTSVRDTLTLLIFDDAVYEVRRIREISRKQLVFLGVTSRLFYISKPTIINM